MPYGIHISGLAEAQRLLGIDFDPALKAATQAIALEVQGRIAPYPPATEANSPGNATGKWYERGYGPRWLRKDGSVGGRKTSEMLGRRWAIRAVGRIGHLIGNAASYARFVHSADEQTMVHARHLWVTDRGVIEAVVRDGTVRRVVVQALLAALRRR